MGRRTTPGLYRNPRGIWRIDKRIRGYGRLQESCQTSKLDRAESYLQIRLEEIQRELIYGVRPRVIWREAATKYLTEATHKSLDRDARDLKQLDRWIGRLELREVHMGTLQPYIRHRRKRGISGGTVNRALAIVRRILNLSARLWRHKSGLTWLETAPMIQFVDWHDRRKPYPLSWDEQKELLRLLPDHLARMVLFKVNTGCRQEEVCGLRWDHEYEIPELSTSVFIVPESKNGEDRLIVLNSIAKSVVESCRGMDSQYVFVCEGHRINVIRTSAWQRAVKKSALPIRVHDLKHTYGRRLRAAGVPLETRKVLLGHKNGDVTTHYSAPEISDLIEASERVAKAVKSKGPSLTLLRVRA